MQKNILGLHFAYIISHHLHVKNCTRHVYLSKDIKILPDLAQAARLFGKQVYFSIKIYLPKEFEPYLAVSKGCYIRGVYTSTGFESECITLVKLRTNYLNFIDSRGPDTIFDRYLEFLLSKNVKKIKFGNLSVPILEHH